MREETLLNIFRQLNEENQYILIAEADSLRTAQKLQEEHLKPESQFYHLHLNGTI